MAENAVVKEQLTEAMIRSGAELTAKLDEMGVAVVAALWFFMPDTNEWRLLFASPEVSTQGPRTVYQKIWKALEEAGGDVAIPFSMIGVIDADADLVVRLQRGIRTGPGISRIRFSKNVTDGRFIDDALIYRAA